MSARQAFIAVQQALFGTVHEQVTTAQREADLKEWNMTQLRLWLDLSKSGVVSPDDPQAFGEFGAWFYTWVESYMEYPTLEDLQQYWLNRV